MPWPNNLPNELTSFIGRERELDEVLALFNSARLVTLTGSGGSGKTRLALQAAGLARGIFPDGAWLIELATVSNPKLVPQTVASTLAVREAPDRSPVETLVDYLQPLKLLLILDNCEHLIDACASLAQTLLRACPQLTILATSRQGLNIEGELCWRVPSLSLPDPAITQSPDELRRYESVQLFVDRAKQRRSDFVLTEQNAQAVTQLCYRLDGIPLAIELAAARIRVLSVEQIVDRLDERFRLLASPNHSLLPRHQTLEAMIDWSYDLLDVPERRLFRALSVFAGSFALEAVVHVAGGDLDEYATIELLSQLVDKSLVMVDEQGRTARYHMLDTLRQYAWQKAAGEGETDELQKRHLEWCVSWSEGTEDKLVSKHQAEWLEKHDKEHDNVRAALAYAVAHTEAEPGDAGTQRSWMGLRLAGSLAWYWYFRGFLSEGRSWLESVLSAAKHPERDAALAKALSAAGVLAYLQSDYAVAHKHLEESLSIWEELNDPRGTAFALTFLGRVLAVEGDPRRREVGERSVEIFRQIKDRWGLALSLDFLGEEAREAERADLASTLHEESLALYRILGHDWGVALELSHFAQVSYSIGDFAEARRRLEEAVLMQRAVGDKSALAWSLDRLGDILLQENDISQAEAVYQECADLFRAVDHHGGTAASLHKWGSAVLKRGDHDLAWQLTAESLNLNRDLNYRQGIIGDLLQMGSIVQHRADFAWARSLYREALTNARALADSMLIRMCIGKLAELNAAQGYWDQAALLLGVADTFRTTKAETGRSPEETERSRTAGMARSHLGERKYENSYGRGLAMPQTDGISLALHYDPTTGEQPTEALAVAVRGSQEQRLSDDTDNQDELTKRELEVLKLMAEGLTDSQVADHLVLSTRTVQAHVRSIYSKLDIATRSAATRYAIKRGLV